MKLCSAAYNALDSSDREYLLPLKQLIDNKQTLKETINLQKAEEFYKKLVDDNFVESLQSAKKQQEYIAKIRSINEKFEETEGRKKTMCIQTFGCQMNAHDSERYLVCLKKWLCRG